LTPKPHPTTAGEFCRFSHATTRVGIADAAARDVERCWTRVISEDLSNQNGDSMRFLGDLTGILYLHKITLKYLDTPHHHLVVSEKNGAIPKIPQVIMVVSLSKPGSLGSQQRVDPLGDPLDSG